jgi:glycerol uptake facilitator-like aquaporin
LGVVLAFGLTVPTMAYAIGHISGCHHNPAVSIGLWAGKRFPGRALAPYIVAQAISGVAGAAMLSVIASGKADFDVWASECAQIDVARLVLTRGGRADRHSKVRFRVESARRHH